MVPYVESAAVAVTVMHVLLFVCMLQECCGVGTWGGVVALSAHMGGIRGPGVLSSAGDVLEMRSIASHPAGRHGRLTQKC